MILNYQRPRKLNVIELKPNYGKFEAEPFERGYAGTIGIALRRVLLSMIEGTAITAIRIDGVMHEFSSIPGVYEDVLNIILNLKNIPFNYKGKDRVILQISKEGEGEVLSGDIKEHSDVEILDKNIHIAYLEAGASFNCEIEIGKGFGYKLAEQNYREDLPVDFIPIDSNYNPIERVKHTVRSARVGKKTDYEKLIIEVWTDGSVCPKESISDSSRILREHMAIFLNYHDKEVVEVVEEEESENSLEFKYEILEKSINELGLSVRARKCLERLGVNYIYELIEKTEHELLNSKNFGKKSLDEIVAKLGDSQLTLGNKLSDSLKKELVERKKKIEEKDKEEILEEE